MRETVERTIKQKPFNVMLDSCIADEIVLLNEQGVRTVNSCCGHGENNPVAIIENNHNSLNNAVGLGYKHKILDILFSEIKLKSECHCLERVKK
ncbi:hypothetical protein SAMN05192534_12319 [Alteribacillus persepolensis]|uniref:Uncharacterized protein n=1 Tax=Alteribacillus persepolensis TaxID=568899 RepID=A0A1G8I7Y1_9BACI|nr:hypothetical protein [Alteribacillus persepolensis]SDI14680.1 hypothetical protein SAMN05192534_12319 [Alteribacillus persepolensis]